MKKIYLLAIAAIATLTSAAQDTQTGNAALYMPLIFERYDNTAATATPTDTLYRLEADDQWLRDAQQRTQRNNELRRALMLASPSLVRYNLATLPEPPEEYAIKSDPGKALLTVAPLPIVQPEEKKVETVAPRLRNWLHEFNGSAQFTQAYISDNWYQGGENNLNILGDLKWNCNLNQDLHPDWIFNNMVHYKVGISTAHGDSLRNYMINVDNFLFTSLVGYKAMKHWYYSATLNFKTQFFNTYKSNTVTRTASFLSPGELNVGLGMTYSYKSEHGERTFNLAIAPLSYNLKMCIDSDIDPTSFGIAAGHRTKHSIGSNIEAKLVMYFTPNISWNSRLYAFTDYKYVQGDWENTFQFNVTKYLNTQIYVHLRYDKSRPRHDKWNYWQLKEILSFGLTYRFATQ